MKYQSLTIGNFRSISKLEINDLKNINLLVGRNNCGKTTILEAIFLLSGMTNPTLSINIHKFRDLIITNDEDFGYMFSNLNFEKPITLKGKLGGKKRELKILPLYSSITPHPSKTIERKELINPQESYSASTTIIHHVEGIKVECRNAQGKIFMGQISLKDRSVSVPGDYKEELKCSYLNPKTSLMNPSKQIENLVVQKKLDSIIKVLKNIEPAVVDIRMGTGDMLYVDIGIEKLLPMNIMGDGLRRILSLLTTLAEAQNGILLMDEIENGLHYTSLKIAWKAIIAACKEFNVQLFATTHSYECVEALSDAYDELEPEKDAIRLFRIEREGDTHIAVSASAQVLRAAFEKNFEVR